MKSIKNSAYAKNFPDTAVESVFMLDGSEAAEVFEEMFGEGVGSFFTCPDTHWLVKADWQIVGRWIEAYNGDESESVRNLLRGVVEWPLNDDVFYIASGFVVLKTKWSAFLALWDSFLACDDDAPIVVNDLLKKEVVMFTPQGEISYIVG